MFSEISLDKYDMMFVIFSQVLVKTIASFQLKALKDPVISLCSCRCTLTVKQ